MAIALSHTFRVWHPSQGLPARFEDLEFHFTYAISRQSARDIVERVEGYVIEKRKGKRRGITMPRQKIRKAKS